MNEIDTDEPDYEFSDEEMAGFIKTKQDYLDGKTTARDWEDVKKDLDKFFD